MARAARDALRERTGECDRRLWRDDVSGRWTEASSAAVVAVLVADIRDASVRHGAVELRYAIGGSGDPPLVFIHGGLSSRHTFAPQIRHFAKTHHVMAPDLRGHGQSSTRESTYTIGTFAEDTAVLCAAEGIARATVVGHSMGALVALDLARSHSDLVRSLVLIEAPVVPPPGWARDAAALLDTLRGSEYPAAVTNWARRLVSSDSPYQERILEDVRLTPQDVAVSCVEQILTFDSAAAVADVRAAILLIGGRIDAERLRAIRPDVTALPALGSGHYGHLDEPAALNTLIEAVLRG